MEKFVYFWHSMELITSNSIELTAQKVNLHFLFEIVFPNGVNEIIMLKELS